MVEVGGAVATRGIAVEEGTDGWRTDGVREEACRYGEDRRGDLVIVGDGTISAGVEPVGIGAVGLDPKWSARGAVRESILTASWCF